MSTAIKDSNLKELITHNTLTANMVDIPDYQTKIVKRLYSNMDDMKTYISQYMNEYTADNNGLDYMLQKNVTTFMTYTNTSLYHNTTQSLGIALQMYILTLFQFSNGVYQKGATEMTLYNNFVNLSNWLSVLQNTTVNSNYNYYDSINKINLSLLLINCSLCIVIAVLIVVIYGYLQNEKQQILSLLSTIDFAHIKQMYQQIGLTLQQILKKNYQTNYSQEYFFLQKKKQISDTTTLPKVKSKIVIVCLFFLIMVCIYPLIQYLTSKSYITQNQVNMQLINQLYNVKAQYLSNMAVHVTYLITRLVPGVRVAPLTVHYARVLQLQSQNGPILEALSQSIKDLQDSISYKSTVYQQFLFQVLNIDACTPFNNYPQYNSANNKINMTTCSTQFNGILSQGLQISSVKYFEIYSSLVDIYSIKDNTLFKQSITNFFSQIGSLQALDNLYETMSNIIVSLDNFVNTMNQDYFSLNFFIQELLMIYQFVLFIILYIFIWIPFQHSIQNELTKAKSIFTNFEISYLIENPYIMNFLKKY